MLTEDIADVMQLYIPDTYIHDVLKDATWFTKLYQENILPTRKEVTEWCNRHYFDGHRLREVYCHIYGFPLLTSEVIQDLSKYLLDQSAMNSYKTLEVCCGSGYLSSLLQSSGVQMIATDNRTYKNSSKTHFFQDDFTDIELIDACDAIDKYHDQIKVVMMSWPNYRSNIAYDVLKKCIKYNLKLIYIGEGYGGCTGNNRFFNLIVNENIEDTITLGLQYVPFPTMHDDIHLLN